MKLIGYCRVSTENQRDEGTIEIQKHALLSYCREQGHELADTFSDDGVSGGLENRPALASLFDYLESHPDTEGVLIYKLDRLARDLYIQEHILRELAKRGKRLVSVKEPDLDSNDPMRKAFRQFMGIVSELEKSFITMRLTDGRMKKARQGKYAGGSPALGYSANGDDLIVNNKQVDTVRAIFKMKRSSKKGFNQIARELNAKGIPTARGGKWYAGTVKYILENPLYRGMMQYNGEKSKRMELALV